MRKISHLGWGLLLCAFILSGCGKLDRKGIPPVNILPEIFFANVPAESLKFSVNPRVSWYGTDKDGYITAYQYAIIKDAVLEVWGGLEAGKDSLRRIGADSASWVYGAARMNIFGTHIAFEEGHQRNVRMYAEMDPDVYTPQHIFLRAVDNKGGISEIKTRMFWRNNHAPEAFMDVDSTFVENNFYCLTDTTKTWKGIEIGWHGLDSLDYPDKRKQPDFYFKWDLWGPYADTLLLTDPFATKIDSSLDSIEIEGDWIHDRWILDKFHVFKNLENYPDSGYGWYQLKVWSRDDAFVSSEGPAATFFRILKPLFLYEEPSRKTILVMDHTGYGGHGGAADSADVWPFYRAALSQPNVCDVFDLYLLGEGELPSEDLLSRHDLTIVLNVGRVAELSEDDYGKYKSYMNIGGRVWVMGMNNYGLTGARGLHYLQVDIGSSSPNTFDVASEYLGVEAEFYPAYSPAAVFLERLEFIGAEPYGAWGLPLLKMDQDKAKKLQNYSPTDVGSNFAKYGIPYVPYDVISTRLDFEGRAPFQRRLYSFSSRRGLNSPMNRMPCATTFIGPTYRTAVFSFPLNVMKDGDDSEPGAHEAFRKVVEWFWEDLP
jgi:hypothetical protein